MGGGKALTPGQALAALQQLEAHEVKGKALMDRHHPMHRAVMDERLELLDFAYPKGVHA